MTVHDETSRRIAIKYDTVYSRIGVDVVSHRDKIAIEVETSKSIAEASKQLNSVIYAGYSLYVAGADALATLMAQTHYRNSKFGVMDENGTILKHHNT